MGEQLVEEHGIRVHVRVLGVLLVHDDLVRVRARVRVRVRVRVRESVRDRVGVGVEVRVRITSGAIQRKEPVSAVSFPLLAPHLLTVCPARGTLRARPRSASLTPLALSMSTFGLLMSRCMYPASCRYAAAEATPLATRRKKPGGVGRLNASPTSPPSQNSSTRPNESGASTHARQQMRFGWRSCVSTANSVRHDSTLHRSELATLTATLLPLYIAKKVLPAEPETGI